MTNNKPKTSKLAIASAICFCIMIAGFVTFQTLGSQENKIIPVLLGALLIISPFIATISLVQIKLSNGRLKGTFRARAIFIISSIFLFQAAAMGPLHLTTQIAQRVVCGTNLKGLFTALDAYANEFDNQLPTPEQWCDLLITNVDVSPKSFKCSSSGAIEGESSYALNMHIAHMKLSQIPPDTVLLFETNAGKSDSVRDYPLKERAYVKELPNEFRYEEPEMVHKERFNQVAGPETLAIEIHKMKKDPGCNILFANGTSKFVNDADEFHKLRWDVDSKVQVPAHLFELPQKHPIYPSTPLLLTIFIAFALATSLFALLLLKRFHFTKHWKFASFLAIPSMFAGGLFGKAGETMCYFDGTIGGTGIIAGAFFGVLTALCYASILADTRPLIKGSFRSYAIYTGIAAGMICSTLTHIAIIIANYPTQLIGLVSGQIFGIITGAILGAICGIYVEKAYNKQSKETGVVNETDTNPTGGE